MNFRVMDEHGRQLGQGRNLAALKAEWGAKARGAFQALASLKLDEPRSLLKIVSQISLQRSLVKRRAAPKNEKSAAKAAPCPEGRAALHQPGALASCRADGNQQGQHHADWLSGVDRPRHARSASRCLTSPKWLPPGTAWACAACLRCRSRTRSSTWKRTFPTCRRWPWPICRWARRKSCAPRSLMWRLTVPSCKSPLPANEADFKQRVQDGRGRLTLIANEVARMAGIILTEYAAAARKIKDTKNAPEATKDAGEQLQKLMPKDFIAVRPLGAAGALRALSEGHHHSPGQIPRRPGTRCRQAQGAAAAGAALLAPGGRAQGPGRCAHAGVPLDAGRAARELFAQELRTPYPVSSQAPGQGLGTAATVKTACGATCVTSITTARHW